MERTSLPKKIYEAFDESGIALVTYECTDSTNRRAREYAEVRGANTPVLFVADRQTEGRGRMGRSFYSPANTGLYMTLLIEAPEGKAFTTLTAVTAVVCRRAIMQVLGLSVGIKWVNDLYLDGLKVAGILAESFVAGDRRYVALGIGINLTTSVFPEDISHTAGGLMPVDYADKTEAEADKTAIVYLTAVGLKNALRGADIGEYMDEYRKASCIIGEDIEFTHSGKVTRGRAVDITDDGALIVMTDGGERLLSSGEISVRKIKKEI